MSDELKKLAEIHHLPDVDIRFIQGVLDTLSCVYWKLAENDGETMKATLCAEGSDILAANDFPYVIEYNEEDEAYIAAPLFLKNTD